MLLFYHDLDLDSIWLYSMKSEEARSAFKKYDAQGNGTVDRDEAKVVLQRELGYNEDESNMLLNTFDRNNDKTLSYDEFVDFYKAVTDK